MAVALRSNGLFVSRLPIRALLHASLEGAPTRIFLRAVNRLRFKHHSNCSNLLGGVGQSGLSEAGHLCGARRGHHWGFGGRFTGRGRRGRRRPRPGGWD